MLYQSVIEMEIVSLRNVVVFNLKRYSSSQSIQELVVPEWKWNEATLPAAHFLLSHHHVRSIQGTKHNKHPFTALRA